MKCSRLLLSRNAATAQGLLTFHSPKARHQASSTAHQASNMAAQQAPPQSRPYKLTPLKGWAAEVHGLDLKEDLDPALVEQIKQDVTEHRLVIIRDQGQVSGQRQVEISQWFGPLESTFYKHPASPHPDVFRVSNNREEGCTGVGRTGWHIDGSFQASPAAAVLPDAATPAGKSPGSPALQAQPFSHSVYHIHACPSQGDTSFAPMMEVLQGIPAEKRAKWSRLSMLSDRRDSPVHPMVCAHPLTGKATMIFHTGMTSGYVWDHGKPGERRATHRETVDILEEIEHTLKEDLAHLVYHHKWKPGDFIFSDNLAVAHEAAPETQLSQTDVGLRVMHRCTVKGQHTPVGLEATAV